MPDGGNPFFVISETNQLPCSVGVENTDSLSVGWEYSLTVLTRRVEDTRLLQIGRHESKDKPTEISGGLTIISLQSFLVLQLAHYAMLRFRLGWLRRCRMHCYHEYYIAHRYGGTKIKRRVSRCRRIITEIKYWRMESYFIWECAYCFENLSYVAYQ